jgi:hypothetical protein
MISSTSTTRSANVEVITCQACEDFREEMRDQSVRLHLVLPTLLPRLFLLSQQDFLRQSQELPTARMKSCLRLHEACELFTVRRNGVQWCDLASVDDPGSAAPGSIPDRSYLPRRSGPPNFFGHRKARVHFTKPTVIHRLEEMGSSSCRCIWSCSTPPSVQTSGDRCDHLQPRRLVLLTLRQSLRRSTKSCCVRESGDQVKYDYLVLPTLLPRLARAVHCRWSGALSITDNLFGCRSIGYSPFGKKWGPVVRLQLCC